MNGLQHNNGGRMLLNQDSVNVDHNYAGKIVAMPAIKGREAPPDGASRNRTYKQQIETPPLPFEAETLRYKARRPVIPKRVQTSMARTRTSKSNEGAYAVRFSDFTWAHTDADSTDHYANRREMIDIAQNFDNTITKIITETNDIDQASAYQAAADLLMDEICDQLRVECIEQADLVERARLSYAHIFELMLKDANQARATIKKLEDGNAHLEENLTKVIDNATERVKDAQEDCQRQIKQIRKEMDDKKEEYDTSMKRFLEQKSQLEEHVKALHRVFLDFQSDSVYITLEDLKQKQEQLEKKIRNKENEISKLNMQLSKMQKQIRDAEDNKAFMEQANDELRRKLQVSMAQASRLQRKLDMQNLEDEAEGDDGQEGAADGNDGLPAKPLITSESVQASTQGHNINRRRSVGRGDPSLYIQIHQKLSKISDRVLDVLQRANAQPMMELNEDTVEIDRMMLTCDVRQMLKAIDGKVDDICKYVDCLENLETLGTSGGGGELPKNIPRFLRYISQHHVEEADLAREKRVGVNIFQLVRQIFQAKYTCDQWHQRMGKPLMRFPEFLIAYHCRDGENMFTALQRCSRLWRNVKEAKSPELKLFRKFTTEKLTVDELSFFLEIRTALLGLPVVTADESPSVNIPYQKCRVLMEKVLGTFSPVLQTIAQEAEKHVYSEYIDYAVFSTIMIKFYQNERRKRRNAVRLMFQSRRFSQGNHIDFENFVAMIQTLGFQGSFDDIFDLFREASLLAGGDITLDALLMAMDNLSFHFYSIEVPVRLNRKSDITAMSRQQLITHWTTFSGWFEGFTQPRDYLDTWLKSKLVGQVRSVDKLFKTNAPIPTLFMEYRSLLDFFQFMLDVMARGQSDVMTAKKSERELQFLENLIDLLVTFVVKNDPEGAVTFTEFA